jgi:hypothetical protein
VISWVFDHSQTRGTDRLVLLAIADSAEDDGTNAWPGVEKIAAKAGVTRRGAQQAIARLRDAGLIGVEEQAGGPKDMRADRRPNRYSVVMATGRTAVHPAAVDGAKTTTGRGAPEGSDGAKATTSRGEQPCALSVLKHPSLDPSQSIRPSRERFAEFYEAYPRHTGKLAAERAWSVRIKAGADPAELVDKARAFAAWVAAGGVDSPRFVPHPATWLNQGREADELPDPRSMSPPAVNGSRRKYDVTDAWADLEKTIGGNDDGSARVASDLRADVRSLPGR